MTRPSIITTMAASSAALASSSKTPDGSMSIPASISKPAGWSPRKRLRRPPAQTPLHPPSGKRLHRGHPQFQPGHREDPLARHPGTDQGRRRLVATARPSARGRGHPARGAVRLHEAVPAADAGALPPRVLSGLRLLWIRLVVAPRCRAASDDPARRGHPCPHPDARRPEPPGPQEYIDIGAFSPQSVTCHFKNWACRRRCWKV